MSSESINSEILRQLGSLDLRVESANRRVVDKIDNIEEKIDTIEQRFVDKVDQITEQLGGADGIRERLTALEVRVEKMSSFPPPPSSTALATIPKHKSNKGIKDHVSTAGVASACVVIIEVVAQLLKGK